MFEKTHQQSSSGFQNNLPMLCNLKVHRRYFGSLYSGTLSVARALFSETQLILLNDFFGIQARTFYENLIAAGSIWLNYCGTESYSKHRILLQVCLLSFQCVSVSIRLSSFQYEHISICSFITWNCSTCIQLIGHYYIVSVNLVISKIVLPLQQKTSPKTLNICLFLLFQK